MDLERFSHRIMPLPKSVRRRTRGYLEDDLSNLSSPTSIFSVTSRPGVMQVLTCEKGKWPKWPTLATEIYVQDDNASREKALACIKPSDFGTHIFSFKWCLLESRQN